MVLVNAQDPTPQAAAAQRNVLPDYVTTPNAVFSDEGVQWRYGRAPDYTKTRKVWREGMIPLLSMCHTCTQLVYWEDSN